MPSPDPSADTSSCAANTTAAYFVAAIFFGVIAAGFGKGLSANPALVKIIEKNVEARDQGGGVTVSRKKQHKPCYACME